MWFHLEPSKSDTAYDGIDWDISIRSNIIQMFVHWRSPNNASYMIDDISWWLSCSSQFFKLFSSFLTVDHLVLVFFFCFLSGILWCTFFEYACEKTVTDVMTDMFEVHWARTNELHSLKLTVSFFPLRIFWFRSLWKSHCCTAQQPPTSYIV